jgi:hypothetical protein
MAAARSLVFSEAQQWLRLAALIPPNGMQLA